MYIGIYKGATTAAFSSSLRNSIPRYLFLRHLTPIYYEYKVEISENKIRM